MKGFLQLTGIALFLQTMPLAAEQIIDSPNAAFETGKALANKGIEAAHQGITPESPRRYIDHYKKNDPEEALYRNNEHGIFHAGKNKLAACEIGDGRSGLSQQECEAINFISRNRAKRTLFKLDPKVDPIITGSKKIINAPEDITGQGRGRSSQRCRVVSETTPATFIEETCTENQIIGRQTCSKRLRVDARMNCDPQKLFPVLDMPRNHIDHIHIYARCDMAALTNDYVEMTADAFGTMGGETRNQTVRIPKNIASLPSAALQNTHARGDALLITTVRPHWAGAIRSVSVYVLPDSPGCVPGTRDCRYHFYWEWVEFRRHDWLRSAQPVLLGSNEGWATGVIGEVITTDHWDDECAELASRTRQSAHGGS